MPIKLAVAFYLQCLNIKDKKLNPKHRIIRNVLEFEIKEKAVEEGGNVRVGCHYILFEEMKGMYELLKSKSLLPNFKKGIDKTKFQRAG